ncbi:MAG TPA: argininosuccinate lyase [Dehalococcoidia bacterium]|nr:argininosuccinate lyase [Dehalococcoidia bacterium]
MQPLRKRFGIEADEEAKTYTTSIGFDWRLWPYDIQGSIAHAKMLGKQGIISEKEAELIVTGLTAIRDEIEHGTFELKAELEDIHMNIEARLTEKIGPIGQKLHTARSRNDQVATDMRLFLKDVIEETIGRLKHYQRALLDLAQANKEVIIPGYTHLQPAQPVLLAQHLLAYFEMAQRDIRRFQDCLERADELPLGSGALAGVPYNIDREFLAKELGFSRIAPNPMDAVSDRDFIIEYQAAASITMMHLSRLAEEIVLWSSAEFSFVEVDDAFATSSSIMPQKKNPDVAELARGKTGRVYGHLLGLLTAMKGLPLAYNRDMQEDKEGLFDTVDTLLPTLDVFAGLVRTLRVNAQRARAAAEGGYILATDLADYLVKKGIPFRQAHGIVARLVAYAIEQGKSFKELELKEYQEFSPHFEEDVRSITVEASVQARNPQVERALERARRLVEGEGG